MVLQKKVNKGNNFDVKMEKLVKEEIKARVLVKQSYDKRVTTTEKEYKIV